ncbi:MAG TPA: hypothetical protein VF914_12475 [Chloroflexia bacterium]
MDKQTQERQVREGLQKYAALNVPDGLSIWPAINNRIRQEPPSRALVQRAATEHPASGEGSPQPGPSTRRATSAGAHPRRQPMINLWLAGLVALVIAVGVGAFTLGSLPQGTQGSPRIPQVDPVPIKQSVNGYTVSLYPSYGADGRIVLTYTVADPKGNNVPVYKLYERAMSVYYEGDPTGSKGAPKLRDDQGRDAPWLGSRFAWSNPSRPEERAPVSDIEAHKFKALCCLDHADVMRLEFGAPTNGESPAVRKLHLEAPIFLPRAVLTPVAQPGATPSPVPTQIKMTKIAYGAVVDARLLFDFSLSPDSTRRVIQVNQAVEAGGVTVTLEKVVVKPGEMYVALRHGSGQDKGKFYPNGMTLAVGDWTSSLITLQDSTFFDPPLDQQGEWTLTISEVVRPDTTNESGKFATLSGPWVFKFRVPPATPTAP